MRIVGRLGAVSFRAWLVLGLVLAISVPVGAQYGWFSLNGGLIARLSSSTTAATIRQDGSGAVLDLYAGTTRIFTAAASGLHTITGSILSTTAYLLGSADTSGVRLDLESGSLACREGDDSAFCDIKALSFGFGSAAASFVYNGTTTSEALYLNGGMRLDNNNALRSVSRWRIVGGSADGTIHIGNYDGSKNLRVQVGTPTCTSNCGTSPTVTGADSAMTVTMGATGSPASGWVVTFGTTWDAAPACMVQSALSGMVVGKMPIVVETTTTTVTVTTNGTAPANGDKYHILCTRGT